MDVPSRIDSGDPDGMIDVIEQPLERGIPLVDEGGDEGDAHDTAVAGHAGLRLGPA